jgi:putative oxidoreductase
MINSDFYSKWMPRVLSVLRMVAAFLLMQHGAQKIFGVLVPAPPPGAPSSHGTFSLVSLMGVAGVLELFGGLLLFLGLFTRPVAFILSGLLAVAYFMSHAPGGFWPILNRGELAALYCFIFLFLSVAGGGEWSLDHLLRRDAPSFR